MRSMFKFVSGVRAKIWITKKAKDTQVGVIRDFTIDNFIWTFQIKGFSG